MLSPAAHLGLRRVLTRSFHVGVQEAGVLPAKGALVTAEAEAGALLAAAAALEARLQQAPVSMQDNAAFSPMHHTGV